jgi:hypothetical protein
LLWTTRPVLIPYIAFSLCSLPEKKTGKRKDKEKEKMKK